MMLTFKKYLTEVERFEHGGNGTEVPQVSGQVDPDTVQSFSDMLEPYEDRYNLWKKQYPFADEWDFFRWILKYLPKGAPWLTPFFLTQETGQDADDVGESEPPGNPPWHGSNPDNGWNNPPPGWFRVPGGSQYDFRYVPEPPFGGPWRWNEDFGRWEKVPDDFVGPPEDYETPEGIIPGQLYPRPYPPPNPWDIGPPSYQPYVRPSAPTVQPFDIIPWQQPGWQAPPGWVDPPSWPPPPNWNPPPGFGWHDFPWFAVPGAPSWMRPPGGIWPPPPSWVPINPNNKPFLNPTINPGIGEPYREPFRPYRNPNWLVR